MKIIIDMNLSPRWADFLVDRGFQAMHWSRLGNANAPDRDIMIFAESHGFCILTHDLDFRSILASAGLRGPSVIQIRSNDIRISVIGATVANALDQMRTELDAGALLSIDANGQRLRLLPLVRRN